MQTLFKGNEFILYRDTEHTYLKNGTVKQIETGQCNSLLTKLHGLTDEQAENFIKSEYEQGSIKVIEETIPKIPIKKPVLTREQIETNIRKCTKGNWLRYQVRVYRNRKIYYKSCTTIEEARVYRDEISQIKSTHWGGDRSKK